MDGKQEEKRQKYINLYVLLSRDESVDNVTRSLDSICQDYACNYVIKKSFLTGFLYIKVLCMRENLEEVREKLETELKKQGDAISWIKVEVIDVK